ncbi:hypothetical protein B296_00044324 [Ensete ventricosum]|uniref:Uncharacterized protein n=1 Tax=Ensete ventricosum TaxID=4639 RepID=A0A426YHT7_ENSVE|nr:hypothetical protein B296_00044324 [Ensete ventricosum]
MWSTRHGEIGLTQVWRGQRLYDRPNTGNVGKVDTPYLQVRASSQGPQTALVRSSGTVNNKEDKGFRYGYPVTVTIKAPAPPRSRGIAKSTTELT